MNVDEERLKKGLYWQRAWKLVEGCTKCSPGCDNCWSESETNMRANHTNPKIMKRARAVSVNPTEDLTVPAGGFSGHVFMREDNLNMPLRIKKPTVFAIWNDLFHEDVQARFIDEVYRVIQKAKQHTFLILTKRPERMASYLSVNHNFQCPWGSNENVYHGVTICNQEEADRNIPLLLQVPGNRFLSIEPMLGAIDLKRFVWTDMNDNIAKKTGTGQTLPQNFHQVLLGGESGKNARPMHPDWIRTIRDQCDAASVPFMFKQWGEWLPGQDAAEKFGPNVCDKFECHYYAPPGRDYGSSEPNRDMYRVGKKKAGRTLDGKLHDDLIWKQEAVKP